MFLDFSGKTALVTGAAGAIGKGIAAAYLKAGASVFITDITQQGVDAAVKELSTLGKCGGLAADVCNEEQVKAVVAGAKELGNGKVDILANVAGIVGQSRIEDQSEADWDKIFAVNCKGTMFFIKHCVPLMKKHKFGKIVNFSSKSGKTGSALMTAYSAAKGAVIAMTQALAFELASDNITVNCLCPGITDHTGVWKNVSAGYIDNMKMSREDVIKTFTSKIPLKRLAAIDDIVAVTLFMSSKGSDYMTGQAINVTGGREMH